MKKRRAKERLQTYSSADAQLNAMQVSAHSQNNNQLLLPMSLDSQLLDLDDMAKIFKVKKQTIYKWKKRGLIKTTSFSRRVTFHRDDVQEFIDRKRKLNNE